MDEKEMLSKMKEKEHRIPYFLKSIEEVNIGAYPLLPNEDSGLLLEDHLRKVILDESVIHQLEVSVPQRGLVYTDDPELALTKKWNRTKVLVFVDVNKVHWDKIETIDSVAVGVEMDLHAFAVVKDFSKAKYVIVTNAGKDEKFRYMLFKVKGEPELVYEIDKEKCLSITYTNPNPKIQNGKKPILPSAYIKFSFDLDALLPSLNISRDGIENTKPDGEDRHRPRIAKVSDIIE